MAMFNPKISIFCIYTTAPTQLSGGACGEEAGNTTTGVQKLSITTVTFIATHSNIANSVNTKLGPVPDVSLQVMRYGRCGQTDAQAPNGNKGHYADLGEEHNVRFGRSG